MATSNITVTTTWTKLADTADDPVLISFASTCYYEIATTVADSAPTGIIGHQLAYSEGVTRDTIGTGYIWARIVDASTTLSSVSAIVTK